MHLFVWGSIIAWFVVIPFMSAGPVYSGFLPLFALYAGVAIEVLGSATFWFYWPLAVMVALSPTICSRITRLDLDPHLVDDVRLLQNKEGRSIFTHQKPSRKPSFRAQSVKRSGYAFAQEEGYGKMIASGKIFGQDEQEVQKKHSQRLSQLIVTNPPTPTRTASPYSVAAGVEASLTLASSVLVSNEVHQVTVEIDVHPPEGEATREPDPEDNGEVTKMEDEGEGTLEAQDVASPSVRVDIPGSVASGPDESGTNSTVNETM